VPDPTPKDDAAEPSPLEVDDAFAVGEPSGQMLSPVAASTPAEDKSSVMMLAIALHVTAAIIVGAVLYWKFAQVPGP
jgi:hypothetical protein